MVCIRSASVEDISEIKACDLLCFPEEDPVTYFSFFSDSILSWPQLAYVAEHGGHIVGYVVAKTLEEEEEEKCQGYISCLGVHPSHRKLGIATKLMTAAENAMVKKYGAEYVYLHVRVSNHAAINFYTKILGYKIHDSAAKFVDDGEDGYGMKKQLQGKQQPDHHLVHGFSHGGGCLWNEAKSPLGFKNNPLLALYHHCFSYIR
ncbi:hypothetical protein MKX01_020364 [Papaver californicum]|nr:hypothetical protein MKX01_020364 [Papaver californicum]